MFWRHWPSVAFDCGSCSSTIAWWSAVIAECKALEITSASRPAGGGPLVGEPPPASVAGDLGLRRRCGRARAGADTRRRWLLAGEGLVLLAELHFLDVRLCPQAPSLRFPLRRGRGQVDVDRL